MHASFVQEGVSIDYTPVSAVAAGDIVVLNDLVAVAKRPISAGVLGALAIEGVFDVAKEDGSDTAIEAGQKVYWDETAEVATTDDSGTVYLGKAVADADDDATTVRVKISP